MERFGTIAHKLKLLEELSSDHDTFHVSSLWRSLTLGTVVIPANKIHANDKLQFIKGLVKVVD
ncbi:hypothetical protein HanIR_Chr15g0762991 [Helianthus annuus]|nr:hypothetical protein HanIR_Chr15g0762991 [Helianthus annuus]